MHGGIKEWNEMRTLIFGRCHFGFERPDHGNRGKAAHSSKHSCKDKSRTQMDGQLWQQLEEIRLL